MLTQADKAALIAAINEAGQKFYQHLLATDEDFAADVGCDLHLEDDSVLPPEERWSPEVRAARFAEFATAYLKGD